MSMLSMTVEVAPEDVSSSISYDYNMLCFGHEVDYTDPRSIDVELLIQNDV
jgi:hypothetical protein